MADQSIEDRIARIRALLAEMEAYNTEVREEILAATEQLLMKARARHEAAVENHRRTMAIVRRRRH